MHEALCVTMTTFLLLFIYFSKLNPTNDKTASTNPGQREEMAIETFVPRC